MTIFLLVEKSENEVILDFVNKKVGQIKMTTLNETYSIECCHT